MEVEVPTTWYKIEQRGKFAAPKQPGAKKGWVWGPWITCLYNGKHTHFDTLGEAQTALQQNSQYPSSEQYRIVKVMEEVVA